MEISHLRPKADRPKGARLRGYTTSGEEVSWWVYDVDDDDDDNDDEEDDEDDDDDYDDGNDNDNDN